MALDGIPEGCCPGLERRYANIKGGVGQSVNRLGVAIAQI